MRFFLFIALFFIVFRLHAQDSIRFHRLDFSQNLLGDSTSFVLRADSTLLMQAPADTNKVSLVKESVFDYGTSWKISVQMNVNPSNSNNIKFYILSDSDDLKNAANAYYVVIGNNADELSLYSQTASSNTKVIDGLDKRLDMDTVRVEVIVSLDKDGKFTLWSKRSGEMEYFEEGTTQIKRTYPGTSFLGVLCTYSKKNTDNFIIEYVGIAPPIAPPPIEEDNFSLSAKSFYNGGEPIYVQYKFPEEGYVARVFTFDGNGNKIEELANNTTLEKEGTLQFRADYPEGIIIVMAEARTKNGTFIRKRMPVVCGR